MINPFKAASFNDRMSEGEKEATKKIIKASKLVTEKLEALIPELRELAENYNEARQAFTGLLGSNEEEKTLTSYFTEKESTLRMEESFYGELASTLQNKAARASTMVEILNLAFTKLKKAKLDLKDGFTPLTEKGLLEGLMKNIAALNDDKDDDDGGNLN